MAVPAWAYRPFDGTDAAVADAGEFELEFGPAGFISAASGRTLTVGAFVANLGLATDWELVLEGRGQAALGAVVAGHRWALGDTGLFGKHVFRHGALQDQAGASAAFEIGPLLPGIFADRGIGAEAAVIVSDRWPGLTVHLNGAARISRNGLPGGFASLIVEGPTDWRARPVAELAVDKGSQSPSAWSGLAGLLWPVSEDAVVDAAVRTEQSRAGSALEVRAGLTVGWQWWRR